MKNAEYWKMRFVELEKASNSYGTEACMQIESAFDSAQRQIQKEIEAWYGRYARNNGITMQEARKHLSTSELKELRWDVKEYIKYGKENALNQQWMKELENASAKFHISRLDALKLRTQQFAEVAFGNQLDCIDAMARKIFTEDYYHSIFELQKGFGIGWEIGQIDQKKLDKFIKKPWALDGKHFSERIWAQRGQLVSEIHQQLTRTCILGKAPNDAINAISKKFGTTKSNAGRLVMTEQAYFHSVAQKEAFNDLDVEEFEIVATLDNETSEICQEMDGKHFPMSTYEAGVTAPPFHPWCRSVTVPWFEDNYTGERAARNADGETYYVPDNMTYKDWKKGMVDGETGGLTPVDPVTKSDPKTETIQDINDRGSNMLAEVYERHRVGNGLTSVPYSDLGQSAKQIVYADYGKMSVESASAFNDTIEELVKEYDTPLQKIRTMTKEEVLSDSFAFVSHQYTVDSAELVINPLKCGNVDKLTERVKELSKKGYCAKIPDAVADRYIATHEFAHTLLNIEQPLSNKTNWLNADYAKIKKARKEILSVYGDYMEEVQALTKKYKALELEAIMSVEESTWKAAEVAKQSLRSVKLSNYSLESADEFLAESFANERLGVSSNPYARKVVDILDKYFKR